MTRAMKARNKKEEVFIISYQLFYHYDCNKDLASSHPSLIYFGPYFSTLMKFWSNICRITEKSGESFSNYVLALFTSTFQSY